MSCETLLTPSSVMEMLTNDTSFLGATYRKEHTTDGDAGLVGDTIYTANPYQACCFLKRTGRMLLSNWARIVPATR